MNTTIVGSLIYGNQNGILAHPLISDDDLDFIEDFFNTKVDVVTVNRGTPYPRPGLMGNDNGVLVGSDTTGPEIMRIFDVLVKN
jgi:translation initiation factor 6